MNLEEGSPVISGLLSAYNQIQKQKQNMDKSIDDVMNKVRLARDLLLITGQIIKEERKPQPLPAPKQPKRKDSSDEDSEEEEMTELTLDFSVQYIWERIKAAMEELDTVIAKYTVDTDTEESKAVRAAHMHLRRANNFIAEMFDKNQMGNDTKIHVPSYMMSEIEALREDREPEQDNNTKCLASDSESSSDASIDIDSISSSDSEPPPKKPEPTVADKLSDLIEGSSDSEGKVDVPFKCLLVPKNKIVIAKWYFNYRKAWEKALKTARLFDADKSMKKVVTMLESPANSIGELKHNVEKAIKACQHWIDISDPGDFDETNGKFVLGQLNKMEWVVDEAMNA